MTMIGNAREWVEDCWNETYEGAPKDGSAWASGDCGRRVLRGGSWYLRAGWYLRSAFRAADYKGSQENDFGFRVARALTP